MKLRKEFKALAMDPASGADTARLLEEQDTELNARLTSSDGVQVLRESTEATPLHRSTDKLWSPYKRDLHTLSFSFLLVFSAFGATQNLESSLNTVSNRNLNSNLKWRIACGYLPLVLECILP